LELGISLAAASSFSLVLDTSATAKPPCDQRLAAAAPMPGPYPIRTHTFMVGLASVVVKRERERERAMERLVVALVEEGRNDGCEWRWSKILGLLRHKLWHKKKSIYTKQTTSNISIS
jgi:hypothetical protein